MIILPGKQKYLDYLEEIENGEHQETKNEIIKIYNEEDGMKKSALYVREFFKIGFMDSKKLVYGIMQLPT